MTGSPSSSDGIRTAEVIGSLCIATDLAMGFPFEHGLHCTCVAMRLADRLGLSSEQRADTFYGCLLFYAGCTTDAATAAAMFPPGALLEHFTPAVYGSPRELLRGIMRALADPARPAAVRAVEGALRLPGAARGHRQHIDAMCEVAEMLAGRLSAPAAVGSLFRDLTGRWDGKGPSDTSGLDLPLPLRVAAVARDTAFQQVIGDVDHALDVARERSGHAFDPAVVAVLDREVLSAVESGSVWDEAMETEPSPHRWLRGAEVDDALSAVGDFADLVSPFLTGHARAVSDLAGRAATALGLPADDVVAVRRAGLVHDIGRVAVDAHIWNKPGGLTADEWERARLHAHHTERILARSPVLARLGVIAGAHHERLDGSGYHRGLVGAALERPARVLAAADAFHTAIEPRPHRPARSSEDAAGAVIELAGSGRLDADAAAAVVTAAGERPPRVRRAAGLTDREVQVVGLVARGLQTKQAGHRLGISVKTADRHLQNAYAKMGVSTRAGATLFAMQHGLVTWGELPMAAAPRHT